MSAPLLSIVIPTYNRPSTLQDCLNSIELQQDFNDFEIVIVDNATPDPAENEMLVKTYQQKLKPRGVLINYIRHKQNVGIVNNKHAGVKLATGKFVVVSDDDDFYLHKKFFASALSALTANPDCKVLLSRAMKIYDDGSPDWFKNTLQNNTRLNTVLRWSKVNGNKYFKGFWTKFTPRQCNAVIVSKESLLAADWFNFHCNDQSFHLLPAVNHCVLVSEQVVCGYRKHSRELVEGNTTLSADPVRCFESHTAIVSWLGFANANFARNEGFLPLVWRMKNLVLKDDGIIVWLSGGNGERLQQYYQLVKRYSAFNYYILRYFSLAQIRLDFKNRDPSTSRFGQTLKYKIRRFVAIAILKLDRLVH